MSPMFPALHYFLAIQRAHDAGFYALAATLKSLYLRDYPQENK